MESYRRINTNNLLVLIRWHVLAITKQKLYKKQVMYDDMNWQPCHTMIPAANRKIWRSDFWNLTVIQNLRSEKLTIQLEVCYNLGQSIQCHRCTICYTFHGRYIRMDTFPDGYHLMTSSYLRHVLLGRSVYEAYPSVWQTVMEQISLY